MRLTCVRDNETPAESEFTRDEELIKEMIAFADEAILLGEAWGVPAGEVAMWALNGTRPEDDPRRGRPDRPEPG